MSVTGFSLGPESLCCSLILFIKRSRRYFIHVICDIDTNTHTLEGREGGRKGRREGEEEGEREETRFGCQSGSSQCNFHS